MMQNPENHLTFGQRLGSIFYHPSQIMMYRKGRNVMQVEVAHFFSVTQDEFLTDYARFSEIVYDELSKADHIPSSWQHCDAYFEQNEMPKGKISRELHYNIWIHEKARQAVVVFRGTRFNKLGDWFANARWISKFIPGVKDHYDELRDRVSGIVDFIHANYGEDIEIATTGHSLGGGLAQQAAYASRYITKVVAFDPSPVTGYSSVKKGERIINSKGLRILRIFEHGEVLAYLRFFLRKLYSLSEVDPEILELRFNFSDKGLVSEHSMSALAFNLESSWIPAVDDPLKAGLEEMSRA